MSEARMPVGWVLGTLYIEHDVHRLVDLPAHAQRRYFDAVRAELRHLYGPAVAASFDEANALRISAKRAPTTVTQS